MCTRYKKALGGLQREEATLITYDDHFTQIKAHINFELVLLQE